MATERMATESIVIHVDSAAARAFRDASEEQKRKLEAMLSLHLLEATRAEQSLRDTMTEISQRAQERGLTPEELRAILDEGQ